MPSSLALLLLSSTPAGAADYNDDGYDDLLVGVPFEQDIRGAEQAGGVHLILGSSSGLTADRDAFLHQNSPGVPGRNSDNENFGMSLGAGDIDGDGKDELVVGAPSETIGGLPRGAIWSIEVRTTASQTIVTRSETFSENSPGVDGTAQDKDEFGAAVAVADFDGDGYDDVVVGIAGKDVGGVSNAGSLHYLRGGAMGITTSGQLLIDRDTSGVAGLTGGSDAFGSVLAAGDFDGDSYADLVIGVPYDDWSTSNEGTAQVLYGTPTGPGATSPDDELWTAGEGTAAGLLQEDNHCGAALAVGDFDGDGFDDLAIGCESYTIGADSFAGAVLLVYGSSSGLDDSELWTQDSPGVIGGAEYGDEFGRPLAADDFDGDGCDDLAVAATLEDYDSLVDNGVVHVLFGSPTGLTDVDNLLLAQDTGSTVFGTPNNNEQWGKSLATGDYDADGYADLVVGSYLDSDGGGLHSGMVNVFYGSASGPSTAGDQWFHQDTPGIVESIEDYDWFGFSLR